MRWNAFPSRRTDVCCGKAHRRRAPWAACDRTPVRDLVHPPTPALQTHDAGGAVSQLLPRQGAGRHETLDGRTLQFPAQVLQRFVTHAGIHGLFEIEFDEQYKFVDIRRVSECTWLTRGVRRFDTGKRDARARPAEQNNLHSAPRSRRQDTMRIMSSALSNAPPLPVDVCLPPQRETHTHNHHTEQQTPPNANKTTRVPLALLQEAWMGGRRIVMLEPLRIAARAAAHYMAAQLDERVGETVGYRVRKESRVSARTRIEVVTEGVLTRMLQDDPALEDVALVIFDEFHERSLQGDLGLALCRETQGALRDDLRLLVMSATLDAAPVAKWLGDAPLVTSEGRAYRVETRYVPSDMRSTNGPQPAQVAAIVRRAIAAEEGCVLVFLPGIADIKRVERLLNEASMPHEVQVTPLYGDLALKLQEQAIRPAPPGRRKVVLATSIAETSLTIEGVRIIVDSGWARVPRFDPVSGMTRLTTLRVSRASAEQRRGRAGRLGPGVCYRLWSEGEQAHLAEFNRPEILEADLAPLALDLAQWGMSDPAQLTWLDAPPPAAYAQARDLLQRLDALDARGTITAHGRDMARLPMHPRLAHMLLRGKALGAGASACELAALLGERDVLKGVRETDVRLRLMALRGETVGGADRAACAHVRKIAAQFRRQLNVEEAGTATDIGAGPLLAQAYPDRVGQRRQGSDARYRLANGRGAFFAEHETLSSEVFICAAVLVGVACV